jgi:hypothetical protein
MRTARAYLAGFGTAGSLLAGAALLFVLASALVAFHGWPQMGAGAAPVSVTVSPASGAGGSRVARRLAAILTAPGAPGVPFGGGVATRSVARRAGAGAKPGGAERVGGTAVPVSTSASGGARSRTGAPVGSGGTGAGGSGGGGPRSPVRRVLRRTTTTVRHVISSAGNQLGSAIRQVGSAAGGAVTTAAHTVIGAVTALQPPAG